MSESSVGPWHEGEIAMQRELGVAQRMSAIGARVIRDFMPDQHRSFFEQLPFAIVGAVDREGRPWASVISGSPGFLSSPDPRSLRIRTRVSDFDPLAAGLRDQEGFGILGIEPWTRRRNRMNGVLRRDGDGWAATVIESFGNCPQYIRPRTISPREDWSDAPAMWAKELSTEAHALIASADTFFVSSYREAEPNHIDVSHRGGPSGFVRIDSPSRLTIPDYSGNMFFNTLGNLRINPRAGLLFVDFVRGDLLQLFGRTELILESPEIATFERAQRLWTVNIEDVVLRRRALPFVAQF